MDFEGETVLDLSTGMSIGFSAGKLGRISSEMLQECLVEFGGCVEDDSMAGMGHPVET